MRIWLVSHPALQSYKQTEGSGMVQHTHRVSSASPHNAAEALGLAETIVGSIGSHKGRHWHCNIGRHPAGLCALVGHFHLCSLSWQLVTCPHCPKPCYTLGADRQQRAQLAAGPPFQERVLFLLLLFGPLCCSNKIYITGQFI